MARKWKELRDPLLADPARAARVAELRRTREEGIGLGRLRETHGKTQVDVAKALGQSQARVSRIERQPDLHLSTLADYVEALGGQLELTAVFEDERIPLAVGNELAKTAAR